MKSYKLKGRFSSNKATITVNLATIHFKEDNVQIVFCPALDLSGSGNSIAEAQESFATNVDAYLEYTTNKGTLWSDLKKMGWTINKNKPATPPPMAELLETNNEFNRIFENFPYKKFDTGINLPAYA